MMPTAGKKPLIILYGMNKVSQFLSLNLSTNHEVIVKCCDPNNIHTVKEPVIDLLINCTNQSVDFPFLSNTGTRVLNIFQLFQEYIKIYDKIYYANYEYNFLLTKRKIIKEDLSYKVFVTGLSYAHRGIDDMLLDKKAINLSLPSQDLYFDYLIAKECLAARNYFKYNILGMAYYSFFWDMSLSSEAWRIKEIYYPIYFDSHHYKLPDDYKMPIGVDKITDFFRFEHTLIDERLIQQCLSSVFGVNFNRQLDERIWNKPCEPLPSELLGKIRAEKHNKRNYEPTRIENEQIFEAYLSLLQLHGVTPIIVIFPTTKYYHDNINETLRNNYYHIINKFKLRYNFQFFDFFYSKMFEEQDFADCDHLNKRGAAKMTKLLNLTVNW